MSTAPHVSWFTDLDTLSEHYGKHSLHHAKLTQAKFPLIPGFVITPHAYYDFMQENNLELKIRQLLSISSFELADSLMQTEFHIKQLFKKAKLTDAFIQELLRFYIKLGPEVIIQLHETGTHNRLHQSKSISAEDKLSQQVIEMWAEMFGGNALWIRHHHKFDHFSTGAEIIVRKKMLAEKVGKVVTIDPTTHARDKIFIMMETPHQGDQYVLSKKNLTLIDRKITHSTEGNKLTLDEILEITKTAKQLEEYLYFPQEITWMYANKKFYISAIKPVSDFVKQQTEKFPKLAIARGKGLNSRIGTGVATIIHKQTDLSHLNSHAVIIA
jgi:pyruvate, water dikinase